jgi:RHS repeat-associated protein
MRSFTLSYSLSISFTIALATLSSAQAAHRLRAAAKAYSILLAGSPNSEASVAHEIAEMRRRIADLRVTDFAASKYPAEYETRWIDRELQVNPRKLTPATRELLRQLRALLNGTRDQECLNEINDRISDKENGQTKSSPKALSDFAFPVNELDSLSKKHLGLVNRFYAFFFKNGERVKCEPSPKNHQVSNQGYLSLNDPILNGGEVFSSIVAKLPDIAAALEFSQNEIRWSPRNGIAWDVETTLRNREGSSAEKSALLISILRKKGIPARFILGNATVKIDELKKLYGVENDRDLYFSFLLFNPAFNPETDWRYLDGSLALTMPHIWVEAFSGGKWIMLDPSAGAVAELPTNSLLGEKDPKELVQDFLFTAESGGGSIVKNKTYIDFVFDRLGEVSSSTASEALKPNLFENLSTYRHASTDGTPAIASDSRCIQESAENLSNAYLWTSGLDVLDPQGKSHASTKSLLYQASKSPYLISHTKGLRRDGATGSGKIQIKRGSSVLASFDATIGDVYSISQIVREPEAYGGRASSRVTPGYFAGENAIIRHEIGHVSEDSLITEVIHLDHLTSDGASNIDRMNSLLNSISLDTSVKSSEIERDIASLRPVRRVSLEMITILSESEPVSVTGSSASIPSDSGFTVDWKWGGYTYPSSGNHLELKDYQAIAWSRGERTLAGSTLEGQVIEDLTGGESISSAKILQIAAQNRSDSSSAPELIEGDTLDRASASRLESEFQGPMSTFRSLLNTYETESPRLYSVTDAVSYKSYHGVGFFLFPTSPNGESATFIERGGKLFLGGTVAYTGEIYRCVLNLSQQLNYLSSDEQASLCEQIASSNPLNGSFCKTPGPIYPGSFLFSTVSSNTDGIGSVRRQCSIFYNFDGPGTFEQDCQYDATHGNFVYPPLVCGSNSVPPAVPCDLAAELNPSYPSGPYLGSGCPQPSPTPTISVTPSPNPSPMPSPSPSPSSNPSPIPSATPSATPEPSPSPNVPDPIPSPSLGPDITPFDPNGDGQNSSNPSQACAGKPVNPASGAMWHTLVDFSLPGRTSDTSIQFARTYMTVSPLGAGDFGTGWRHSFEARLVRENSATNSNLIYSDENGTVWRLTYFTDGLYSTPLGMDATFEVKSDSYRLRYNGGKVLTFSRNPRIAPIGALIQISDRHSESIDLAYSNGLLSSLQEPMIGRIEFDRNNSGKIIQIRRVRDGVTHNFLYDAKGRLISSVDTIGRLTRYKYLESSNPRTNGLLSEIIDPLGRSIAFTYFSNGKASVQTDHGGAQFSFFYSLSTSDPSTRVRGTDGLVTEYHFDNLNRLIETIRPDGGRERREWNTANRVSRTVDASGYVNDFQWDTRGNLIGLKAPGDLVPSSITYDRDTDQVTSVNPASRIGTASYDISNAGDVVGETRGGLKNKYNVDTYGNRRGFDNGSETYSNDLDSDGLLVRAFVLRNSEERSYDNRKRLVRRNFSGGQVLTYRYDDADRLLEIMNSHGPGIRLTYDAGDRIIKREEVSGSEIHATQYSYDDRDRLISVKDPLGKVTRYEYDRIASHCIASDKPSRIIDAEGHVTEFTYDPNMRLITSKDPRGEITSYSYNLRGDLLSVTVPSGSETVFTYNGRGKVIEKRASSVDAKNNLVVELTTYEYQGNSDLVSRERHGIEGSSSGVEIDYVWDSLGRMLSKVQSSYGTKATDNKVYESASYSYAPIIDRDLVVGAENGVIRHSLAYELAPPYSLKSVDEASVDSRNLIADGHQELTYSDSGALASVKENGVTLYSATSDPAGRWTSVVSSYGSGHTVNLGYDGFGRKSSVSHVDGPNEAVGFDALDRMTAVHWTGKESQGMSEALVYSDAGKVNSIQRELGTLNYSYDLANELIKTAYSGNALPSSINRSFQYDGNGNRVYDSRNGGAVLIADQLLADQTAIYGSDDLGLGRRTSAKHGQTPETFEYRPDGLMTRYTKTEGYGPGLKTTEARYTFDAFGRRVAKSLVINGSSFSQVFRYFGDSSEILLAKAGNGDEYLSMKDQGTGEPYAEIGPTGAKSYVKDHLGSVLNSKVAGGKMDYGSFGELLGAVPALSATTNPYMPSYAGYMYDAESGKYQTEYRHYDPVTGRFLQKDPIGFGGEDINLYRYVKNRPLDMSDPLGLDGGFPGGSSAFFGGIAEYFPDIVDKLSKIGLAFGGSGLVVVSAPELAGFCLLNPALCTELGLAATGSAAQVATGDSLPFSPANTALEQLINAIGYVGTPIQNACGKK